MLSSSAFLFLMGEFLMYVLKFGPSKRVFILVFSGKVIIHCGLWTVQKLWTAPSKCNVVMKVVLLPQDPYCIFGAYPARFPVWAFS